MILLAVVLLILGGCATDRENRERGLQETLIVEIEEIDFGLYLATGRVTQPWNWMTQEKKHAVLAKIRKQCAQQNKLLLVGRKGAEGSSYEIAFRCQGNAGSLIHRRPPKAAVIPPTTTTLDGSQSGKNLGSAPGRHYAERPQRGSSQRRR